MNSDQIHQTLEQIKSTSAKNDKIELLKTALEDTEFLWAIQQMLDPRIRFGVAKKTLDQIEGEYTQNPDFNVTFDSGRLPVDVKLMLESLADGTLTGSAAKERLGVCLELLSWDSWCVLRRILLKKPDAGIEKSVNKARPGTIWSFDCMLAHPFEAKRVKQWPVAVEPKYDGVRCLIMVRKTGQGIDIGFFSRTGKEYTTFDHMREPLAELMSDFEGAVIDCEMVSGSFNETVSQARKKDGAALDAVAKIFDIVIFPDWEAGKSSFSYQDRREVLTDVFGPATSSKHPAFMVSPVRIARSEDEVIEINARFQADGLEGSIVKPLDHLYERKRSHSWMKIKGFETHDIVITGMFEGTGKYEGSMGGVICDFDGVEVRVGGGWTDEDRSVMWADQGQFIGRMIEVGAHEKTPDGSLRHPRFLRFRDDKYEQEAA